MNPEEEKGALEALENKLYDPKARIDNVSLHHVRDRKEKELPTSWSDDTPIIRAADDGVGLSFGAKFLIGALALLLIVLAFTAWRVLSSKNIVSERNIDFTLSIDPYVEGGEASPLTVSIINNNKVNLEEALLTLTYKQGTGSQDEEEKIQEKRDLGTIVPGDFRKQDFEVMLYGSEGEARDITARLEYKVSGANAKFSKTAVTQVVLKSPPISVAIEGPDTLSVGQSGTFSITVTNNTATSTAASLLMLTLPNNFTLESSSQKQSSRGSAWQVPALSAGESKMLQITGSLSGNQGETSTIKAIIGSIGTGGAQIGVMYANDIHDVKLRTSPIVLTMNVSTDQGREGLRYGDRALLLIKYQNTGSDTLQNPEVTLKISGDAPLLSGVHSDNGYYDSTTGTITWSRASLENFESLPAGAQGTLQVSIPIVTKGSNSPKLVLSTTMQASSKEVNDVVASASKTFVVQGSASLSASTHYKDSSFQNTGPIPPQANVHTTYTVHLATSAQNALTNAKVSFVLPAYVTWRNVSTDPSKITYDSKTRTVSWAIGSLAEGKTITAQVGVSVRPSQVHVGRSPAITSALVLDADEEVSRAHIRVSVSPLTTAISGETWGFNPSVVVGE